MGFKSLQCKEKASPISRLQRINNIFFFKKLEVGVFFVVKVDHLYININIFSFFFVNNIFSLLML